MKKWYVGDQFDNFDEYECAENAGKQADGMIRDGFEGVYILYLTEEEFEEFTRTGHHLVGKKHIGV